MSKALDPRNTLRKIHLISIHYITHHKRLMSDSIHFVPPSENTLKDDSSIGSDNSNEQKNSTQEEKQIRPPIAKFLFIPNKIIDTNTYFRSHSHHHGEAEDFLKKRIENEEKDEVLMMKHQIKLTEREDKIIELLKDCIEHFKLDIVLRFAGGWVRDKLLGYESEDIDVSIDRMMGEDFAVKFNHYLSKCGFPTSHIGIIAARPNQSKHLETATVSVLGQRIDFVNLRCEIYSESRIPVSVKYGTPIEDAHRRDITINALFYNIHTKSVEDFTEKGLVDLKNKYIRTPLPAKEIFLDDPLRILRVIRFASRFNYTIDPEILKAVKIEQIKNAFKDKITRERIGCELKKMIYGPNPALALNLMDLFGFHTAVFLPPPMRAWVSPVEPNFVINECHRQARIFTKLFEFFIPYFRLPPTPDSVLKELESATEDAENAMTMKRTTVPFMDPVKFVLWIGMSLLPFRKYLSNKMGIDRGIIIPVNENICRHSLKMSNYQTDQILRTVEVVDYITEFISKYQAPFDQYKLASCLRLVGPRWEIAWIMAHVTYYYNQWIKHIPPKKANLSSSADISIEIKMAAEDIVIEEDKVKEIIDKFEVFRHYVFEYNLDRLWTTKPILNGKEVISILNIKKPDAYLSRVLCELVLWQLCQANSSSITKDQATDAVNMIASTLAEKLLTADYPPKEF